MPGHSELEQFMAEHRLKRGVQFSRQHRTRLRRKGGAKLHESFDRISVTYTAHAVFF